MPRELNLEDVQELLLIKHGVLHPQDVSPGDAGSILDDLVRTAPHDKLALLASEIDISLELLDLEKIISRNNPSLRGKPRHAKTLRFLSRFRAELPCEVVTH